jgi:hypothetical protein
MTIQLATRPSPSVRLRRALDDTPNLAGPTRESHAHKAHMKIDITMTTAFALFHAIMVEGMLNRLSDSSAFAREDAER